MKCSRLYSRLISVLVVRVIDPVPFSDKISSMVRSIVSKRILSAGVLFSISHCRRTRRRIAFGMVRMVSMLRWYGCVGGTTNEHE